MKKLFSKQNPLSNSIVKYNTNFISYLLSAKNFLNTRVHLFKQALLYCYSQLLHSKRTSSKSEFGRTKDDRTFGIYIYITI